MFNEDIISSVWEKGVKIEGLDPSLFRKDACGALIMKDKYGMQNPYGWQIDHVLPQSLGGTDVLDNLRPLHYLNNASKAADYPSYTSAVAFDGKQNITFKKNLTVNSNLREKLRQYYKNA